MIKNTPPLPLTLALIASMMAIIWMTGSLNPEDELLERLKLESVATVENAELSRLRLIADELTLLHTLTVKISHAEPLSEDLKVFTQLKKLVVLGVGQPNDLSVLKSLPQLQSLTLQNIFLPDSSNVLAFFKGTGLKELGLVACGLLDVQLSPEDFGALEKLDLSKNQLTLENEDHSLHLLPELRGLNLDQNRLTRLPSGLFFHPKLTCLSLANNRMVSDPTPVPNYQSLLLADETSALQTLSLAHNQLSFIPEEVLKARNLRSLDLSHNILEIVSRGLNDLTQLERLDLQHNKLTYLSYDLGGLVNLVELDFSHNELNYLCEGIERWMSLKRLYLEHNELYHLSDTLLDLPNLMKITTEGNSILYTAREDEWNALLSTRTHRGPMVRLPCVKQ